jgi:phosphate transport system protein
MRFRSSPVLDDAVTGASPMTDRRHAMRTMLDSELEKLQKLFALHCQELIELVEGVIRSREPDLQLVFESLNRLLVESNKINENCSRLLCLHSPKATDLRLILAIFRTNESLRFLTKDAVSIAKRKNEPGFALLESDASFQELSDIAWRMLLTSFRAFVSGRTLVAEHLPYIQRTRVESLYRLVSAHLSALVKNHEMAAEAVVDLDGVARKFKHFADHALEMQSNRMYISSGDVSARHVSLSPTLEAWC